MLTPPDFSSKRIQPRGFITILIILILSVGHIGLGEEPKKVITQEPQRVFEFPFTLETLTADDVPRCLNDGSIDAHMQKYAQDFADYLANNSSYTYRYEDLVAAYKAEVERQLTEDYSVVHVPYQGKVDTILATLLPYSGLPTDVETKIYIVERSTGQEYYNCHVLPGAIMMGRKYLEFLHKHGGWDGVSLTISHEISHIIVNSFTKLFHQEEWKQRAEEVVGTMGRKAVTLVISITDKLKFSRREEALSDMAALYIMNESPYSTFKALNARLELAKLAEKEDKYRFSWSSSHPLTGDRSACLRDYLLRYEVKSEVVASLE